MDYRIGLRPRIFLGQFAMAATTKLTNAWHAKRLIQFRSVGFPVLLVSLLICTGCLCRVNDRNGNSHLQTGTEDCGPFYTNPEAVGPPQRGIEGERCQTVKRGSGYETICEPPACHGHSCLAE